MLSYEYDEGDFCRFALESRPTKIGKGLLYAGMPKKSFSRKQAYADISVFLRLWRLPKIRPMAIFERKNLMEQLNPLLE